MLGTTGERHWTRPHCFLEDKGVPQSFNPREDPGDKSRNVSYVSPACLKRRLNGAVSRNNRINIVAAFREMHVSPAKHSSASVTDGRADRQTDGQTTDKVIPMCRYASQATQKGWSRVGAWTGTVKNPTKCLWRWEPDRRFNFFFNPPVHLYAVTYITEISLHVTLNNQSYSPSQSFKPIKITVTRNHWYPDRPISSHAWKAITSIQ